MKQVRIAELKARLSEHLKAVRRGERITILDRDTPVAQIVPIEARPRLKVRMPAPGTPPLKEFKLPDESIDLGFDIVDVLLEDRQRR